MGHIADDRLSARVDVDMFDHHLLPSTSPHVRQRISLLLRIARDLERLAERLHTLIQERSASSE